MVDYTDLRKQMKQLLPSNWVFAIRSELQQVTGLRQFIITRGDGFSIVYSDRQQALAYAQGVSRSGWRSVDAELEKKKNEAQEKAITNLGRYKFMNFGYWAAVWIHLNQLSRKRDPSPFRPFVELARSMGGKRLLNAHEEKAHEEVTNNNKGETE